MFVCCCCCFCCYIIESPNNGYKKNRKNMGHFSMQITRLSNHPSFKINVSASSFGRLNLLSVARPTTERKAQLNGRGVYISVLRCTNWFLCSKIKRFCWNPATNHYLNNWVFFFYSLYNIHPWFGYFDNQVCIFNKPIMVIIKIIIIHLV